MICGTHPLRLGLLLLIIIGVHGQACEPNCPYTANKYKACENRQNESAAPAEGYALSFGPQMIAATKTRFLDGTNTEVSRLADGFTMTAWVRWNDGTMIRKQPPVTLGHSQDADFWKPFNKLYEFNIAGMSVGTYSVYDWKIDGKWHHISVSWNNADGVVRAHVDGLSGSEVFRIEGGPRGIGDTFLDKQSFLLLGLGCKLGLQAECDPKVSS